jgi:hypothetical protein
MDVKKLEAGFVCDISECLSQGELVTFSCQSSREVVFTVAKRALDYREEKSGASFAKAKSKDGQDYSVYLIADGELTHCTDIINEPYNIHFTQLLGQGHLLLSCSRSRYRSKNDFDKNGRLYSRDGHLQSEILLGDGIQDVQTTRNGIIWTSYFDEGVIGNYGWDNPVGSSGLVAWEQGGQQVYQYEPQSGLDSILDCYALNVESNNIAWFYYYTEFQLVKVKNFSVVDYWNIPVSGSDSFAVYRNYALFHGGYDDRQSLYFVQLKESHKVKTLYRIELTNVSGFEQVIARGDTMYFLSESLVYKIELSALLVGAHSV